MHPDFDRTRSWRFRVSRVRHVMAVPTLGYPRRVPPIATNVEGLYIVNSAQIVNGTLNVNETLGVVERALPVAAARRGARIRQTRSAA